MSVSLVHLKTQVGNFVIWSDARAMLAALNSAAFCFANSDWPHVGIIAKTLGAFGSGFANFGFGGDDDSASHGQKAAKPTEQEASASWAAF